jgi:hypothetical protein
MALIEPHYPKDGGGRNPYPLETMLRIHLLQNWFSLSDPAIEEEMYEITPPFEDITIMKFDTCWRSTRWPPAFSKSSVIICRTRAYRRAKAPLLTLRSSMHPA